MQLPPPPAGGFLNFQQQPIPQQPVASTTVSNQQQKVHQLSQFKANYQQQQNQQQVQVATQTTQASHHHHPAAESLPHATPTSGKSVVPVKKLVSDSKRKDKSSRYARQTAAGQNQFQVSYFIFLNYIFFKSFIKICYKRKINFYKIDF